MIEKEKVFIRGIYMRGSSDIPKLDDIGRKIEVV